MVCAGEIRIHAPRSYGCSRLPLDNEDYFSKAKILQFLVGTSMAKKRAAENRSLRVGDFNSKRSGFKYELIHP